MNGTPKGVKVPDPAKRKYSNQGTEPISVRNRELIDMVDNKHYVTIHSLDHDLPSRSRTPTPEQVAPTRKHWAWLTWPLMRWPWLKSPWLWGSILGGAALLYGGSKLLKKRNEHFGAPSLGHQYLPTPLPPTPTPHLPPVNMTNVLAGH